jgi:small subunit ribosomal protein S15
MSIDSEVKKKLIIEYATSAGDTGSPEVQIAILSRRISNLTTHFLIHKKDTLSKHGLNVMIGKRRRLLNYLKSKDIERYKTIIKRVGLRK